MERKQLPICESCRPLLVDLLERRISEILAVADEQPGSETIGHAQAHCFHLMELRSIVEGKPTCGVFDDYGEPPTITGPLLDAVTTERGRRG